MKLQNQIALVTGGSRGLGAAIAIALAEAGADIAINYQHAEAKAEDVKTAIEKLGRRAVTVRADVANSSDVHTMATAVERSLGAPTILVNNAGIARAQKIEDIRENDWDEILSVNLKSVFLVTQRILPAMRAARFGRLINLTSVAAQLGGVVGPHYAASKAGIIGITHSYAALLVKEGITANAISPALIATDMVTTNLNAKPERIPVGRFGEPDEVASVAVMLASNAYITGQTINVNGGWYMSS
ncbi:MAG: 3-oxoacyl-[acyl-carrier-protein] reductase [Bryobacterales bacterium]|jgi:3-oxoacyl-[acyl-carrier protein] reductase|nr:3-oxoacyl-[acyl-carrier-protein] reductase [Bryobacterales bacterium]